MGNPFRFYPFFTLYFFFNPSFKRRDFEDGRLKKILVEYTSMPATPATLRLTLNLIMVVIVVIVVVILLWDN